MFKKIKYEDLNPRQQENYNFHTFAAKLAEYGYMSIPLNDDWNGADFLAIHVNGKDTLKVQLKSRFCFHQKYIGNNLYIAFIHEDKFYIYLHDKTLEIATELQKNTKISKVFTNTTSWKKDKKAYSWPNPPDWAKGLFHEL